VSGVPRKGIKTVGFGAFSNFLRHIIFRHLKKAHNQRTDFLKKSTALHGIGEREVTDLDCPSVMDRFSLNVHF